MSNDEKDKKMDVAVQRILEKGKYDACTISDIIDDVFGETISWDVESEVLTRIREEFRKRCQTKSPL